MKSFISKIFFKYLQLYSHVKNIITPRTAGGSFSSAEGANSRGVETFSDMLSLLLTARYWLRHYLFPYLLANDLAAVRRRKVVANHALQEECFVSHFTPIASKLSPVVSKSSDNRSVVLLATDTVSMCFNAYEK